MSRRSIAHILIMAGAAFSSLVLALVAGAAEAQTTVAAMEHAGRK